MRPGSFAIMPADRSARLGVTAGPSAGLDGPRRVRPADGGLGRLRHPGRRAAAAGSTRSSPAGHEVIDARGGALAAPSRTKPRRQGAPPDAQPVLTLPSAPAIFGPLPLRRP